MQTYIILGPSSVFVYLAVLTSKSFSALVALFVALEPWLYLLPPSMDDPSCLEISLLYV